LNNLNNLEVIEMTSATKRARKQNERAEVPKCSVNIKTLVNIFHTLSSYG